MSSETQRSLPRTLAKLALNHRGYSSRFWLDEVTTAAMFGECYLLGLWAALGGLRVLARWSLVSLVYVAGMISIACIEWFTWSSTSETLVDALFISLLADPPLVLFALGSFLLTLKWQKRIAGT